MKIALICFLLLFVLGSWAVYRLKNPVFKTPALKNDSIPADSSLLRAHVEKLCGLPGPRNYERTDMLDTVAAYIFERMKSYGYEPSYQEYSIGEKTYRNVICSYGKKELPVLVIGAHYDVCETHQGADDNASGVAGLLELSRLMKLNNPALQYRIEFVAYTLEEPPYFRTPNMGSAVHAKSLVDQKVNIKAMVCLEMIGYFSDKKNSQQYPAPGMGLIYPKTGNFISVVGKTGEHDLVKHMKSHMMSASRLPVESINAPASIPGIDFSDHQNYWKYNIPAVMITDTSFYRNHNYHQATDTPDTLDYTRMTEVVRGVYNAVVSF